MDDNDMRRKCSGCLIYEQHLIDPDNYKECSGFLSNDIKCPCINCVVKVMCDESCEKIRKRPWFKIDPDMLSE